ncbi:MAG: metal ABC transporter ATP-binding protein [Deltaproteobacteria bacterium]|nr:metal ABC transporter ATP-binding protein [Deltaproteobacteria bacterium]
MTEAAEIAVRFRGVKFAYPGGQSIFDGVSLEIREREFVSIVGPNGGGKTTFVKLLLGLLEPVQGTVELLGSTPKVARAGVGYMPQHVHLDMQFPVNVMDVVMMGRLSRERRIGGFRGGDRAAARAALASVEIEDLAARSFASLSGGQRQRTLIARALASEPRMLVLDEPTANLDIRVEREFYELLRKLNERLTIVIVSHDLSFVSTYVQTVVCVNRDVHTHPTRAISPEMMSDIYGGRMKIVVHDEKM